MTLKGSNSHGKDTQRRVRRILEAVLDYGDGFASSARKSNPIKCQWRDKRNCFILSVHNAQVQDIATQANRDGKLSSISTDQVKEAFGDLEALGIFQDRRGAKTQGVILWQFDLILEAKDRQRILAKFDELWKSKWNSQRSLASKSKSTSGRQFETPLKPGAPFPRVRVPQNFVKRPDALNAVKEKLRAESDQTLVVSTISGLGGLGKSVLAAALVLDAEVQARFADGILWVTLGQNPDLQTLLGDWIRELDKSRESFSTTTLESASRYLNNLLAERRMLLVVDDVWNAAHAEWFRVGGAGCRVLMTTREAQIEGADHYPLDLMSEEEAIDLVRQKLGQQWRSEQEPEIKAFAKVLGYLPLALDLAANQVRDGLTWAELQAEFEAERRAVALELLDSSEAWELLDEEEQRKYSLRACFNLSLRRLQPERLQRFAWLGVLPEDVSLDARVALVLWDLPPLKAKRELIGLRQRSFLTSGVATVEGELTYRMHDLMHDMARSLIKNGTLPTPNLASAHRQFLERYREHATDHRWDQLPNDGYIYRHLTWHMEQADWVDEVHTLMATSDEQGRNAWFEACDRIGQPAIFVEDVARGWRLVEREYEHDRKRSIVLQCRYALITATLNSLASNLPIGMVAEFVRREFWTVEHAWAYVEQIQNEWRLVEAIKALAPYLSRSLFQLAVCKARSMQNACCQAELLVYFASMDSTYFLEALAATRALESKSDQAIFLSELASIDAVYFPEALAAVQASGLEFREAGKVLDKLAKLDASAFPALVAAVQSIQRDSWRAQLLSELASIDAAWFPEASAAARSIQDETIRASALSELAAIDAAYFPDVLTAAQSIQDEDQREHTLTNVLIQLASVDIDYFPEALAAIQSIQDENQRVEMLSRLASNSAADSSVFLDAIHSLQDEHNRAKVLNKLAIMNPAYFPEALAAVQSLHSHERAEALNNLAKLDSANCSSLLEAARSLQDQETQAEILVELAAINTDYFPEMLVAVRLMQNDSRRAGILIDLARDDLAYFPEALEAARAIHDASGEAWALIDLVRIDVDYLPEALSAAQAIKDASRRAWALRRLASISATCLPEALSAAQAMKDEYDRVETLIDLASIDVAYVPKAFSAAQAMRNENGRAEMLSKLAGIDTTYFPKALAAVRSLQSEDDRASCLVKLASINAAYFREALTTVQAIQWKHNQEVYLSRLAEVTTADFSALSAIARSLQDENMRASVLLKLAEIDAAYFPEALAAVQTLRDERKRVWNLTLRNLAEKLPEELLGKVITTIPTLTYKDDCASVLSNFLPRLYLSTLLYSDWKTYLHLLACRERTALIHDLVTLYPAIINLGGEAAMRGVIDTMYEVFSQWK